MRALRSLRSVDPDGRGLGRSVIPEHCHGAHNDRARAATQARPLDEQVRMRATERPPSAAVAGLRSSVRKVIGYAGLSVGTCFEGEHQRLGDGVTISKRDTTCIRGREPMVSQCKEESPFLLRTSPFVTRRREGTQRTGLSDEVSIGLDPSQSVFSSRPSRLPCGSTILTSSTLAQLLRTQ